MHAFLSKMLTSFCLASSLVVLTPESSLARGPKKVNAPAVMAPIEAMDLEGSGYAYPYPVQRFAFQSQGQSLEMAYLDVAPAKKANGRVIVLLHGKNFGAYAWKDTIATLSKAGFRVIAPDQIGFGKSSKPQGYQFSFLQLVENTHALLASLHIPKATIVGHSMGGMLAAHFALWRPEATERLVMVNPLGLEDYSRLVPPRTIDQWYQGELKQTPETIRDYQRKFYYDGAWSPQYEDLIRLPAGWTQHPDFPRMAMIGAQTMEMVMTQPMVNHLPYLKVPATLIVGLRDKTAPGAAFAPEEVRATMGNYPAMSEAIKAKVPQLDLVTLPGLGHSPQIEDFPTWEKVLLKTLSQPN